ncbi:GPI-anchor transamidase GPI17 ASCRUDRAFT_39959, partial [Ascoidea rubescens DSM 1968]
MKAFLLVSALLIIPSILLFNFNYNYSFLIASLTSTKSLLNDLHITIPIELRVEDGMNYPDLHLAVQTQLNHEIFSGPLLLDYNFQISTLVSASANSSYDTSHSAYNVKLFLTEDKDESIYVDSLERFGVLYYNLETINTNDLPFYITQTIFYNMFLDEYKL